MTVFLGGQKKNKERGKKKKMLFARKITEPQLQEYVACFKDTCEIVWVDNYTPIKCLPFIKSKKSVYFMQIGPSMELATILSEMDVPMHLVNTEQITRLAVENKQEEVPFPFEEFVLRYLRGKNPICRSVIDYSAENIALLEPHISNQVTCRLKCFLPPLQQTPQEWNKTRDIVFVGDTSSQRRKTILSQLPDVHILQNTFGQLRDTLLFTCKVLVNIHYGPSYMVFEELRCLSCVLAKTIVVSEYSLLDKRHPICKFIVFASYDTLVDTVKKVLQHYDTYVTMLFEQQKDKFETLLSDIREYEDAINSQKKNTGL